MTVGASFGDSRMAPDTGGLARSAAAVFGVRIAAAGFAFGAQALMARLMGGAEYGIFASVWVWTALLGHASTWGLSQAASRFLPAYRATGEADLARGYIAFGAAVSLGAGALLAGAGAAVVILVPGAVAEPYAAPLLVAALVLPLFALQDYCEGLARAQHWTLLAIAPPYLLRQGLIMAAMLAALALGAPPEAATAVACTLIATALALAVQAALLSSRLRQVLPPGRRAWPWRRWMNAALPIGLIDLAGSGFAFADVLVLGFLLEPEAVGVYFAATRLLQFLAFVHYAASAVTAPRIAEAGAQDDQTGLDRLVRHWSRLTLLATLATGLGLLAASPLLLGLFGTEFGSALPLLAILVAGHVGASVFGPAEDVLTMLGAERLCAAITLAVLGFSIVLMLLLVPGLGVTGAALSAALAVALRGCLLAAAARLRLGVVTPAFAGSLA